ncbi:carbohydrate ABC transporter permease [Candidatus Epulonipiscium viviparus]|uniref:carbohydrate ABC transporter permease n=1 Tax=Candidatus Epulonipiscium viviparus TaxID=420336 RepID=UPI00016C0A1E|nr:sugar ABC transporter permease [Candidatus Epulopiscium viviparus]
MKKIQKNHKLLTKLTPLFFLAPAIILLVAVILYPVCKVIQYSFIDNIINDNYTYVGFDNYITVLTDSRLVPMISFTLLFTIVSVLAHTVIGILCAVQLNVKINPKALAIFRVIYVLPWLFTAAVVAVIWQLMLNPQGVVNSLLSSISGTQVIIDWLGNPTLAVVSLLIINAWRGYPTCMISFLAGLQNIPDSIYEAAQMDGAGKIRQFFSMTLPSLKNVILSVGILDAIWTMNLFPLIWLTTGGGPLGATETLATLIYRLSFVEFQFGPASALAVMGLILSMVGVGIYMKVQRNVD